MKMTREHIIYWMGESLQPLLDAVLESVECKFGLNLDFECEFGLECDFGSVSSVCALNHTVCAMSSVSSVCAVSSVCP